MISFYRVVKHSLQDIYRNIWLSAINITIIILALVSINFLIVLNTVSTMAINTFENKVDISVYFHNYVNDNQIYEMQSVLISMPEIRDVLFISKEEALATFKEQHVKDKVILQSLEELDENPLGVTLVVKAKTTKDYAGILTVLEDPKFSSLIKDTTYQENHFVIEKIAEINDKIKSIGLFVSLIFILISFIVILNTIRITIYTHRDELRIMKLVGAANWFVKGPYLVQSIIFSFISAGIAIMLIYPFLNFIQPFLEEFLGVDNMNLLEFFKNKLLVIFIVEFLVTAVFSVFSSNFAIHKYLEE